MILPDRMATLLAAWVFATAPAPALVLKLRPLRPEFVHGERVLLLLSATNDGDEKFGPPGGVVKGSWEHRRSDGSWELCHRESWTTPIESELSIATRPDFRSHETRNLGLVFPACIETSGQKEYEVRLKGAVGCCGASHPVKVKLVPGTSADARARAAQNDRAEYTDSILAGYDFLSWREIDRLYEDPSVSLEMGSYRFLHGDELQPSIDRMKAFLKNFPSFPFAQSIRLRLATELALTGRTAEARAQLREITGTPQEPHVREDARRLEAALRSRSLGDAGNGGRSP